jgi:hypothetical protein
MKHHLLVMKHHVTIFLEISQPIKVFFRKELRNIIYDPLLCYYVFLYLTNK